MNTPTTWRELQPGDVIKLLGNPRCHWISNLWNQEVVISTLNSITFKALLEQLPIQNFPIWVQDASDKDWPWEFVRHKHVPVEPKSLCIDTIRKVRFTNICED